MTGEVEQLLTATFAAPNIQIPGLPVVPGPAVSAIWVYPGTDVAHSQNLVSATAVVQLGSPGYTPYSITGCLGGATPIGLDTGIKDDNKTFTLMFVARHTGAVDAQSSIPIANNDNSTSFGVSNALIGTTGWQVATNASGINRTLAVTGITNWKMYCVSFDDVAHQQSMFNLTDGTQDIFTGTGSRNLSANGNWYIGANPRTAIGTRTCDVAFAGLIKGQAINLATAQLYYANVKANLAIRGFTATI